MVGIYKITNNINNHCYIGQSRNIEKRWYNHKNDSTNQNSEKYNYPLYCGFRKYGIRNFTFEVLEECSIEELNEKEKYWIEYYKPKYNQTSGGDYRIVPQKLTYEQVQEIQKILIEDQDFKISREELKKLIREEPFTKIGNEYGFSDSAIRKLCKNYSLPYTKKEINSYNDEEWKSI